MHETNLCVIGITPRQCFILSRAFNSGASHRAQLATAVKCHGPGAGLSRPGSRATDGRGNKYNLLLLSCSEGASVLTVAGNVRLQLFGVQREKKWLCLPCSVLLVWDLIRNPSSKDLSHFIYSFLHCHSGKDVIVLLLL